MTLFLLLLALTLAPQSGHGVTLERGSCPPFWFSFYGRCYKYVATLMTWADAELRCVAEGANLASIHSQEDNDFVTALIQNFDPLQGHTWIGLYDAQKEGAWMWSDGSAFSFEAWEAGEPNNNDRREDCVHTNFEKPSEWNDSVCSLKFPSVCATRLDCSQQLI